MAMFGSRDFHGLAPRRVVVVNEKPQKVIYVERQQSPAGELAQTAGGFLGLALGVGLLGAALKP